MSNLKNANDGNLNTEDSAVKKLSKDPKTRLDDVGVLLYGKSYRRKLARTCGVSYSLAYKWPALEVGLMDEYLLAAVQYELAGLSKRHALLTAVRDALMKLPTRA
jgi:hypothetical protein